MSNHPEYSAIDYSVDLQNTQRYFIDAYEFSYYLIPVDLHNKWGEVFLEEFYGEDFQKALAEFDKYKIDSKINDYEIVLVKK